MQPRNTKNQLPPSCLCAFPNIFTPWLDVALDKSLVAQQGKTCPDAVNQ